MGIAPYIREIGRGKEGARSLTEPQAHDLMCQVLDGRVTDLEVGAFALAMRVKGESVDELMGFVRATTERCLPLHPAAPIVVLPSYNGARKLPNLTALLALLLAQEGVNVLVHGPAQDPDRTTTAEVFRHLGLACAKDAADAHNAWSRHEPVFIATDAWCPPLARLLAVRRVVGVRNSGHTVAKLLAPEATHPSLRVMNHTHPEYALLLGEFTRSIKADAMLLRGTEGASAGRCVPTCRAPRKTACWRRCRCCRASTMPRPPPTTSRPWSVAKSQRQGRCRRRWTVWWLHSLPPRRLPR
jgi:anthranilate phosphoribosyltransferase